MDGPYVQAVEIVVAWVNSLPNLVGAGKPLPGGAAPDGQQRRSPGQGAYALLSLIQSSPDPTEAPIHAATISASVYGMVSANAELAAVAYANALDAVQRFGPVVIVTAKYGSARLDSVDGITGPLRSPDGDEDRYLVDATFQLVPLT